MIAQSMQFHYPWKGRFLYLSRTVKKSFIFFLLMAFSAYAAVAQQKTIYAAAVTGSYTTGSATATTRTEGTMTVNNATSSSRAYAVFDVGDSIPSTATITSVTVTFYISAVSGSQTPTYAVYGYAGDLSTVTDAATLYADCISGTSLYTSSWGTQVANKTLATNANAVSFIQNNITGKVSLGWKIGASSRVYTIANETGNTTSTATSGHAPVLTINYTMPCSGQPVAGTINPSATTGCGPYTSNLSLTGATVGSGLTYQWDSSSDNSTFYPVSGATNATYAAPVSSNAYYECTVTCTSSTLNATTPSVNLQAPIYSTLPYSEGFESIGAADDLPTCMKATDIGNDGDDEEYTFTGPYATDDGSGPTLSAHSGTNFASFGYLAGNDYFWTPAFNLTAGVTYQFSFWYVTDGQQTWNLDVEYGNTQNAAGMTNTAVGPPMTNLLNTSYAQWIGTITPTTTGAYFIGIHSTAESGCCNYNMGIDDIGLVQLNECSGQPTAGTFTASPSNGCTAYASSLSLDAPPAFDGIAYQWQSSPDGINWSNVAGATQSAYTANVSANIYYRDSVTCTNGNLNSITPAQELIYAPVIPVFATLPYNQGFESWIGGCYTYDRPDASWVLNPTSGDLSWRRDDQGTDASWDNVAGDGYSPASSQGVHSARIHVGEDAGSGNMDLYVDLSGPGTKQLNFDYINPDEFGFNYITVYLSTDSGQNFTQVQQYAAEADSWTTENLTINSTSAQSVIRFSGTGDFEGIDLGVDNVQVLTQVACSGTPVAATTTATQLSSCTAFTSTLSIPNDATTGLTYQWQASSDNINWLNVSGATDISYTASVSSSTYYRDSVTCTASGLSANSSAVYLQILTPVATTASLPYFQGFENWIGTCYNYDRPDGNWLTSPPYGDNAWRRDDQGGDAGWDDAGFGAYGVASTEGSHSARYHSSESESGTGTMDLHIDLTQPGLKNISFDYINASGTDFLDVYLSEDGNTFLPLGHYTTSTGWSTENLTTSSVAANAVLRFVATTDFGSSDIGIDSLYVVRLPDCAGAPVAGTFTASTATGCSEYTSTLTLSAPPPFSGIGYQWQSSADGVTWNNVAGATNSSYSAFVNTNVYYRDSVTCTVTGDGATTPSTELLYTGLAPQYATVPFFETFENWIAGCETSDRPDVYWLTNPATGNNSWRRDDQGADASWSNNANNSGIYAPVFTDGAHSARFHSRGAANGTVGNMDLYIDLSGGAGGTKEIAFDYINTAGTDVLNVQLSEDNGNTFTTLGQFTTAAAWTSKFVLTTSVSPTAIIRFSATSDHTASDIGIDSLYISELTTCLGPPTAGTFTASVTSSCSPYHSVLTLDNPTLLTGIAYQWQSSADNQTWTDVSGATSYNYTAAVSANTYYRAKVTCTNTGDFDTTASQELLYTAPALVYGTLPFFEGFENWIAGCFSFDRPSASWITSPTSGDNSWRRDDQGSDANWDGPPTDGAYSPASTEGSHSARFHSYDIEEDNESTGNMDVYLDLSAPGIKRINFDYINQDEFDDNTLTILLSTDNGATFTQLGQYGEADSWTSVALNTTTTSSQAVLRFQGTGEFAESDMGVDSLSIIVLQPCAGAPVAGTVNAGQVTGCSSFGTSLYVADNGLTGLTYQWQSSTDSANWTSLGGANAISFATTVNGSIYYRVIVTCTNSGLSDTSAGLHLQIVSPIVSFATLPYSQGFENWIGTCFNHDRPDNSWLTNPSTGDNSWRRDDQGNDASWDFPADGTYTPASSEGSHSARFHAEELFGQTGDLDLYIDFSTPGTKQVNFDYLNQDGFDDNLTVYLSTDSGITFNPIGNYGEADNWTTETLAVNSDSSHVVIRFEGYSDFAFPDLGIDNLNITIEPACSGVPVAGTFSASQTDSCSAYNSTLTLDNPTMMSGITYQWQSSTDGTTWSNVFGATDVTYTAAVNANVYYRALVTCTNSGDFDSTAATELLYSAPVPVYATLPYFEGFENWTAGCFTYDRPDSNWLTSPAHGNNSWRRDDQGSDAGWGGLNGANTGAYTPASTEGLHSARFHSRSAQNGTVGNIDLYINLSSAGSKNISFDYINTTGDDVLTVELSEDGGNNFTTLGQFTTTDTWANEIVNTTSTAAQAIIRFSAMSDHVNTDIGVDSLYIYNPCSAPLNVTASDISASGADVIWDSIAGVNGYEYVLNTVATSPIGTGTATTDTSDDATGLQPGTTYYFHVRTDCNATDTSGWTTISFTTLDTCIAPANLAISSITDSSAVATWTAATGITGYLYEVDQQSSDPTGPGTFTTATPITLTGLTDTTNYCFHVRTVCSAGDTSSWATLCFNTLSSDSSSGVVNINRGNFSIIANPNPSTGMVYVTITGTQYGKAYIRLTDVTGKVMSTVKLDGTKASLDLSAFASGIYFIDYTDDVRNQVIKLVKD